MASESAIDSVFLGDTVTFFIRLTNTTLLRSSSVRVDVTVRPRTLLHSLAISVGKRADGGAVLGCAIASTAGSVGTGCALRREICAHGKCLPFNG